MMVVGLGFEIWMLPGIVLTRTNTQSVRTKRPINHSHALKISQKKRQTLSTNTLEADCRKIK